MRNSKALLATPPRLFHADVLRCCVYWRMLPKRESYSNVGRVIHIKFLRLPTERRTVKTYYRAEEKAGSKRRRPRPPPLTLTHTHTPFSVAKKFFQVKLENIKFLH